MQLPLAVEGPGPGTALKGLFCSGGPWSCGTVLKGLLVALSIMQGCLDYKSKDALLGAWFIPMQWPSRSEC